MINFKDLLDACQALALSAKLEPNEEAVWRSICRSYSKKFNTPLHVVLTLDPEHVILNHYEEQLEDIDAEEQAEQLLDIIYGLEDPEYEQQKREELDSFIKEAEEQEKERIKAGRPIHKALKDELPKFDKPKELPKSGGINLSYLESEENGIFED